MSERGSLAVSSMYATSEGHWVDVLGTRRECVVAMADEDRALEHGFTCRQVST